MSDYLIHYGYAAVFAYVLLSQLGVPAPSGPLMVAVGALAANGRIGLVPSGAAVVFACIIADTVWYRIGQVRGRQVVRLLCRMSLEPGSCVQATETALHRYGPRFLLISKFIPGLGLMAAPVAGESRTPYARFLRFDIGGASLWAATYLGIGRFLGGVIEHNAHLVDLMRRYGAAALVAGVLAIILGRVVRQRLSRTRQAKVGISAADLRARLDGGESVFVIDLRSATDKREASLPRAIRMTAEEVLVPGTVPTDRMTVIVCDCPAGAASAEVAATLRGQGFLRVHHLLGGLEAWTLAGYSMNETEKRSPASVGAEVPS